MSEAKIDTAMDGYRLVLLGERRKGFRRSHVSFKQQPFEAEGHPHSPYYLAGGAIEAIGRDTATGKEIVSPARINKWMKDGITSFGLRINTAKIEGETGWKHLAIPAADVDAIKIQVPNTETLERITRQYDAGQHLRRRTPVSFVNEPEDDEAARLRRIETARRDLEASVRRRAERAAAHQLRAAAPRI